MHRCYIAIDLKSFYASYECVERGLDPLTARLVVADFSRTEKTICLAISPALKALLGVGGRARLYEVLDRAKRKDIDFVAAAPQMRKYVAASHKINEIYARFVAPSDIHVYSIDEVFIDVTDYLNLYQCDAHELAERMIHVVLKETGITATAGVGTNLYLAKVTMDIVAKHLPADQRGARIAELDEMTYRRKLWSHTPLTDFWRIGPGIARRLNKLGIHTMGELARYSLTGSSKLYAEFGVNAELIIDHAWGYEPVTMQDVKTYESANHSLSSGQVLRRPYAHDEARLIVWEMADALALNLFEKGLLTDMVELYIGYEKVAPGYHGETAIDHYGRVVPRPAHGRAHLVKPTCSAKLITSEILNLFDKLCDSKLFVRRVMISALVEKQGENRENHAGMFFQRDIFTNYDEIKKKEEREKRLFAAELAIKKKYGKNAILKAANYEEGATMRERNAQIGGHKA